MNRAKCGCLKKEGRIWKHSHCSWRRGLFEKIAEEEDFEAESLLEENRFGETRIQYYLPEKEVIISGKGIDEDRIEGYDPKLLVLFSEPSDTVQYLEYNCDILVISEKGNRFVDSDKEVESSIDEMINRLVRDLAEMRRQEQGKDHDRIQAAMKKLGKEMGYFPEEEIGISGLRADVAWRERENGDIILCGEIETSSGWKKDLLSTWETQPELAVLTTTSHSTNKVAKDLAKLYVMDEMPHQFLYLNFETGDGFLFDGNDPVAKYTIGQDIHEKSEKNFSIEEI